MSIEEHKALVRRFVEECYNPGKLALMDELFARDFVNHDPAAPQVRDLAGLTDMFRAQLAAFPDRQTIVEDLIAEGDMVTKRFTFRGTQLDEWAGIPATGKHVSMTGIDILRIVDGQIAEIWWGYDVLGVLQQLGVVPVPEQVAA